MPLRNIRRSHSEGGRGKGLQAQHNPVEARFKKTVDRFRGRVKGWAAEGLTKEKMVARVTEWLLRSGDSEQIAKRRAKRIVERILEGEATGGEK